MVASYPTPIHSDINIGLHPLACGRCMNLFMPSVFSGFQSFVEKCSISFTPISGYEIGSEHPPINSTTLVSSEDIFWYTYFQVVSSGFHNKNVCYMFQSNSEVAIHNCSAIIRVI